MCFAMLVILLESHARKGKGTIESKGNYLLKVSNINVAVHFYEVVRLDFFFY
jgi:hypothetical protein